MKNRYSFIADQLRDLIKENIRIGVEKLPTEAALCRRYSASRQTVRKALAQLESEGMLTSRQGSGYYTTGSLGDPRRNQIAILLPTDAEYLFPALISGLQSDLREAGFALQAHVHENTFTRERALLQSLLEMPPRGILIWGCKSALPNPNLLLYKRLRSMGTQLLFLEESYPELSEIPVLRADILQGSRYLIDCLLSHGHEQIACLLPWESYVAREFYANCSGFLSSAGLFLDDTHTFWYNTEDLSVLRTRGNASFLTTFISTKLTGCTAILCQTDEIAYYLIRELTATGYHIPEDFSVIAYEGSYLSELSQVTITTLQSASSADTLAHTAAAAMLKLCKGLQVPSADLPMQLMLRASVSDAQ